MQIIAIGNRSFVTGFQLAGVLSQEVDTANEAWKIIKNTVTNPQIGLILLSDNFIEQLKDQLTNLRSKQPIPLIYGVPSPGSKPINMSYRDMLKQILGV